MAAAQRVILSRFRPDAAGAAHASTRSSGSSRRPATAFLGSGVILSQRFRIPRSSNIHGISSLDHSRNPRERDTLSRENDSGINQALCATLFHRKNVRHFGTLSTFFLFSFFHDQSSFTIDGCIQNLECAVINRKTFP